MAVDVDGTRSEFGVRAAQPLFPLLLAGVRSRYDVSADGQRFIVNYSPEEGSQQPITVIVNWTAGLQK